MLRNRVAEFNGADNFLEAAETVLREPFVDLAVVRKVDDLVGMYDVGDLVTSKSLVSQFMDAVPQARKAKKVIKPLWNDYSGLFSDRINPSFTLMGGQIIDYPSERHIDGTSAGLLTVSARVDSQHDLSRTFYGRKKMGKLGIDSKGNVTVAGVISCRSMGRMGLSAVEQRPGDIVLFANFPQVTTHMVTMQKDRGIPFKQPERRPVSLVLSGGLHFPSMESLY